MDHPTNRRTFVEIKDSSKDYSAYDQLTRYAKDLSKVYKSVKERSKALEVANQQLFKYAEDLNNNILMLKNTHKDLQDAYLDTIHRLVLAAEYRDEDTGEHIIRISHYSAMIAKKLGLPSNEVKNILYAAPMHDVGKIGIPDSILMKPSKLTEKEFHFMKTHTTIGAKILEDSRAEILRLAEQIAISHHERWNGKGYPRGLSGSDIPIVGRIVGLADVFDALTSRRPYKEPYPVDFVCDIIKKKSGHHFEPELSHLLLENIDEFLNIKEEVDYSENVPFPGFIKSERDCNEMISEVS